MMKVYSIFSSVNGEVGPLGIGSPCTFIRFAGCSAGCLWCDTKYAEDPSSGKDMSADDVLREVISRPSKNITITGGEPLEQARSLCVLLGLLATQKYNVTVETNGLHDFDAKDYGNTHWVVDIKPRLPVSKSRIINMHLRTTDFIKIVVGSYQEFLGMLYTKMQLQFAGVAARFAFSPEYGRVTPNTLLKWIMESKEGDIYLNFQAHKELNLSEPD